jgi:ubiquitin thioesterase protein OTUB1
MTILRSEYENGSPSFLKQIDWLMQHGFAHIQRTRGDGDCFYRSLAFAYVEDILNAADKNLAVGRSLSLLEATKATLDAAGIEQFVYEDFYDTLLSLIEGVTKPGTGGVLTAAMLLQAFQEAEVSNAIVMALRLLTSAQIRQHRDDYEGFLVHPDTKDLMDVDSFCNNVVQALGKEADNVEIQALTKALQLNLDLAYLNGVRMDGVDFIPFRNNPDSDAQPLVLLYRPGHYDILVYQ